MTTIIDPVLPAVGSRETLVEAYEEYAKPFVARLQRLLRIDRVYARAAGDVLTDTDGNEVLDLLGGYGSTLLGHNHPRLVQTLCDAYAAGIPTHVQASIRGPAARLAERVNETFQRSYPGAEKYYVHLASTGTEAVEAAIKHALMAYVDKRDTWLTRIEKALTDRIDQDPGDPMIEVLESWKATIADEPPILLALEGSFHGKTAGSLSVTSNTKFKTMFDRSPLPVAFLDPRDLEQCRAVVSRLVRETPFPELPRFSPIVGVIFEPLQGEGGMYPLSASFAAWMAQVREELRVPLIADEIQCGFYRTGTFLCCEHLGLRPDYFLLGKSLGGGLGKISAVCIAASHYVDRFSYVHSSTFAEDEPASIVALEAMNEIERLSPSVAERARRFEARMRDGIAAIQRDVGSIISEVRGRGFMLGIDFDLAGEHADIPLFLKTVTDAGIGSYLFMSYFLAKHEIRVGVTLSKPTVVRIEPSLYLTDAQVDRFLDALRTLATLLRDRRMLAITAHLWRDTFDETALDAVSRPLVRVPAAKRLGAYRVGFVTHVIDLENVRSMDASLAVLSASERRRFMATFGDVAEPVVYHEQEIESSSGERILLELYGIMRTTDYFEQSLRDRNLDALNEVRSAIGLAVKRGAVLTGLGQYTSIVSSNGLLVKDYGPSITTGNSLTAGFAFRTLERSLREQGRELGDCRIGIVGAAGNICNVITQVIGDRAAALTLIHRDDRESLARMALAHERIHLQSRIPPSRVDVTCVMERLADCDAVVLGTNTTKHLLLPEHLKQDAVIIDISVPSNVHPSVFAERPDVRAYHGALATLPNGQVLRSAWLPLPKGQVYACLAETITLGLRRHQGHFNVGTLRKEQVLAALGLAADAGVELGKAVPLKVRER